MLPAIGPHQGRAGLPHHSRDRGLMRGISRRATDWFTDTRLGKGPHRIVDGKRGIDDAKGQHRTARLTKPHVELDERSQSECGQDWFMARLRRAMGGNQVGCQPGASRTAASAALPVIKPSSTIGMRAAAARIMAPVSAAISRPPTAASTPITSQASG